MVFKNRVLTRIYWPRRPEATVEWRNVRNEDLRNFDSSPNITTVIKLRTLRIGEMRNTYRSFVEKPKKRSLGRQSVYDRIKLKQALKKRDASVWN
jgi:hypothetical protein